MSDFEILTLRRLADKSEGTRVVKYDEDTGDRKLVNPATPGNDHEPWPTLGMTIEGTLPELTSIDLGYANQLVSEGLLVRKGERAVARPAGPHSSPWSKEPHVFTHADFLVFKDYNRGDVVYKVLQQPDKYLFHPARDNVVENYDNLTAEDLPNTVVAHYYTLQLVDMLEGEG